MIKSPNQLELKVKRIQCRNPQMLLKKTTCDPQLKVNKIHFYL